MDSSIGLLGSLLAGGVGTCTGELLSLPLDTIKVRLQLNSTAGFNYSNSPSFGSNVNNKIRVDGTQSVYSSQSNNILNKQKILKNGSINSKNTFVNVLVRMIKEEGVLSPWKGLSAGLQRQLIYGSLRIGIYSDIRNFFCKNEEEKQNCPMYKKILAGMISGAISMLIANPTDVVKVRLQGDMQKKSSNNLNDVSSKPRYKGSVDAYTQIIRKEGVLGLWTGIAPNVMRNCIVNAAELAAYDQIKQKLLYYDLLKDGIALHFCAGFLAGFSAVCVGSPVDVTKTRLMNAKPYEYKNVFDVVKKTYTNDGILGFYKGFFPNVYRLGLFNIICFTVYEQIIHKLKTTSYFSP